MRKIVCLIALFVVFFVLSSVDVVKAQVKEIKMQYMNAPPHIFIDSKTNKVSGVAYELLEKYIAKEMNVKFVWGNTVTTVPKQLSRLESEDYVSALLIYTPERGEKFACSAKPYYKSAPAIAVLKGNKLKKVTSASDLYGMTFGYAANTTITPFMKNDQIKFDLVSLPNFNEVNIKKVKAKRIDGVYAPDYNGIRYSIKLLNFTKDFRVITLPDTPASYHVVFPKNMKEMADKYNSAFDKVDGQKIYIQILKKYVGEI